MTYVQVTGGYELGYVTEHAVHWCINHFGIEPSRINVSIKNSIQGKRMGCWGTCNEGDRKHTYDIEVVAAQPLRDFIATIVHEMVHVKQWEKGKWSGNGEREAEKLQYKLTDKMWKEGEI
jgi:hypothetical protein